MPRVPVLNIDTDLRQSDTWLDASASRAWAMINDEGYFYLTGSAVLPLDIEPVIDAATRFFDLPNEEKMRFYIGHSPIHRGYLPVGEEGPADEEPDLKEGFDSGMPQLFGTRDDGTGWPSTPGFRSEVTRWKQHMAAVATHLASVFARAMNLPTTYLTDRATDPPNQLRVLHYPPSPIPRQGVGTHTDFECFTLLATTSGGLEVQRPDGTWTAVPPRPDTLIVTTGDTLEIMTNGGLRAARHRVGWVFGERRFSFPYFFSLDADTMVEPMEAFIGPSGTHYGSTTAGEHLLRRTQETFRYLREAGEAKA